MKKEKNLHQNITERFSPSSNNTQIRVRFIDQCKGIGIILVVYGHCTTVSFLNNEKWAEGFAAWFTSFHMPLFFLLGGCLLALKQETFVFPKTLIKKAKRLLLPGLYFSLITIFMFSLVKLLGENDWKTYLAENLSALITLNFQGAMWFLPCYFFAECAFLLLMKRKLLKYQPLVIAVVCFILSVFCVDIIPGNHNRISRLLMAICFVAIGYCLFEMFISKIIQTKTEGINTNCLGELKIAVGGVLLLCIGSLDAKYNGITQCVGASYGRSPILFLAGGVVGTVGFALIFIAINKRISILEFYGKNSLAILCTHKFYIDVFWILNSQILHFPLEAIDARVFSLGVILLETPTILIVNRYFPWLIGQKRQRA